MKKTLLVSGSALALVLLATPVFAGFAVTVTGNGVLAAPPASAVPGADASPLYQVFNENSGTLASSVTLDYNGTPGSYNGLSAFTPTTLAAGTAFGTTMVQLDPEIAGVVHSGIATITFSTAILGIALRGTSLDSTDPLGHPGTTYPTGYSPAAPDTRGIDFRTNDRFTVSADGKTLTVALTANFKGFDELRVFTAGGAASGVPEPASLVVWSVLGAVVAGGTWLRRRPPAI
jgi:hypothetical protein